MCLGNFYPSLNQPSGPIQSLSCDVSLLCVHATFCDNFIFNFFTPIHKGLSSKRLITKKFHRKKSCKEIGLRFTNFVSEMVENCSVKKGFVGFCHSLLIAPGQYEQQHPTVHSGGVSRGRASSSEFWCSDM